MNGQAKDFGGKQSLPCEHVPSLTFTGGREFVDSYTCSCERCSELVTFGVGPRLRLVTPDFFIGGEPVVGPSLFEELDEGRQSGTTSAERSPTSVPGVSLEGEQT